MTIEEELILVEQIKEGINNLKQNIFSLNICCRINLEIYQICQKHNIDISKLISGDSGHKWTRNLVPLLDPHIEKIGLYTPRKGYYKIIDIKNEVNLPQSIKRSNKAYYAHYNALVSDNFTDEIVIINGDPLISNSSVGPKNINIKKGMIIQIKEDTLVVNRSYKIIWDIVGNSQTTNDYDEDDEYFDYCMSEPFD